MGAPKHGHMRQRPGLREKVEVLGPPGGGGNTRRAKGVGAQACGGNRGALREVWEREPLV
eukprot:221293-Chlamydomonas_euryale.AAC.2